MTINLLDSVPTLISVAATAIISWAMGVHHAMKMTRKRENALAEHVGLLEAIRLHLEHGKDTVAREKLTRLINLLQKVYARPISRARKLREIPFQTAVRNRCSSEHPTSGG